MALSWENYWRDARFYYFRDHTVSEAWAVRDTKTDKIVAREMDKNDAAAFACFLNGDIEHAKELRVER